MSAEPRLNLLFWETVEALILLLHFWQKDNNKTKHSLSSRHIPGACCSLSCFSAQDLVDPAFPSGLGPSPPGAGPGTGGSTWGENHFRPAVFSAGCTSNSGHFKDLEYLENTYSEFKLNWSGVASECYFLEHPLHLPR